MKVIYRLDACVDCTLYIANGDDESGVAEKIADRWTAAEQQGMSVACADDESTCDEFSWRACEACGSPLGGARHLVVILGEERAR